MEAPAVCDHFWPAMRQSTQYSEVVKGVAELCNERPQLEKVVLEIEVSGDAVSIKGKQMG